MSPRLRPVAVAVALGVAICGASSPRAFAAPGPIRLVSSNGIEQADFAESPALSEDGNFVAFRGKVGGVTGLYRKDLASGELALVVSGEGSSEPAISADGRYVSFTTTEQLDPVNDLEARSSDVYVADMATTPPTYELASALSGCDPREPAPFPACGLSYESIAGSVATGRVSLSASGREVVFVTTTASDLTEPNAAPGTFPTPEMQVAVRNLQTDQTTLISGTYDPLLGLTRSGTPVPGGAVLKAGGQQLAPGASISADGSTVAWLAEHLTAQVPLAGSEAASIAAMEAGNGDPYDEPLVRRVPEPIGEGPPAQRIVTGQDFPEMVSGANHGIENGCANAAGWNLGGGQAVPMLSADGSRVAMVGQPDGYADAFVAEVGGAASVWRLTKSPPLPLNNPCEAAQSRFLAGNAVIKTIAIAPEGGRVAFTTLRQKFPLSPPNLVTVPPSGVGAEELYLVDLRQSTLERLTHGDTASEPSLVEEDGQVGANSVSFSGDGETLAFASGADNLVPDDGNGNGNGASSGSGSDAFVVTDPRSGAAAGTSRISLPPPALRPRTRWALTAHASSLADGTVRVAVGVPGAGKLGAVARTVPAGKRRAGKVATARRQAQLASVLVFVLHPARGLRSQVHAPDGLEATLRLHFAGKGGKPLTDSLDVRFRHHRGKGHGK